MLRLGGCGGTWLTTEGKSTEIPLAEAISCATSAAAHADLHTFNFNTQMHPSDLSQGNTQGDGKDGKDGNASNTRVTQEALSRS